jgi:hypothetical protein
VKLVSYVKGRTQAEGVQNRVLGKVFGPKTHLRKSHSVELHNLCLLPNIIQMIKSSRMIRVWHVTYMLEKRNVYKILVGKPEGKEITWKT